MLVSPIFALFWIYICIRLWVRACTYVYNTSVLYEIVIYGKIHTYYICIYTRIETHPPLPAAAFSSHKHCPPLVPTPGIVSLRPYCCCHCCRRWYITIIIKISTIIHYVYFISRYIGYLCECECVRV